MDHKIGSGARCAMIGYGSWATALAKVLTENEPSIGWYVRNPEVLESLRNKGRNPRYLSNVRFDRTRINPSDDLDRVVSEADIVILASPSAYLKKTLETLTVPLKDKFVISAIKGIVPDDYTTVVEYIHDHYGLSFKQLGIITGPSHAERFRSNGSPTLRWFAPIRKIRIRSDTNSPLNISNSPIQPTCTASNMLPS